MGAGIDPKVLHRRIYKRLLAIRLRLANANVCYSYRNLEIRGDNFAIYYAGCGPASNGESFHWPVLRFNPLRNPAGCRRQEGDVDYAYNCPAKFEDGFAMVISRAQAAAVLQPDEQGFAQLLVQPRQLLAGLLQRCRRLRELVAEMERAEGDRRTANSAPANADNADGSVPWAV